MVSVILVLASRAKQLDHRTISIIYAGKKGKRSKVKKKSTPRVKVSKGLGSLRSGELCFLLYRNPPNFGIGVRL